MTRETPQDQGRKAAPEGAGAAAVAPGPQATPEPAPAPEPAPEAPADSPADFRRPTPWRADPPPAHGRRGRRSGLVSRLVLVCTALLLALTAYGLTGRPIRLPVWVVAEVEARINRALGPAMPGGKVALDGLEVALDDDWVPRLRLEDLRLLMSDGRVLLALPEARIALDPDAALHGRFRPYSLKFSGAQVALRRDGEGHYDVALAEAEGAAAGPRIDSFSALFDAADRLAATPALATLRVIEADALSVTLQDAASGQVWALGDGRLTLENRPEALAAQMGFSLLGAKGGAGRAEVTLVSEKGTPAARINARIAGVDARALAGQLPSLAPLAVLDAAISGELAARLDDQGVVGLDGQLSLGAGALHPTEAAAPVAFDRGHFALHYDAATGRLALSDISVEGPALRVQAEGQSYLVGAGGKRLSGPLGHERPEAFLTQIAFRDVRIDPEGLFQAPVQFSDGALDLRLTLQPFKVEIGQLSLADGDQRLTARGALGADDKGWSTALDLRLNHIAHDRLTALWPVRLVPRTRDWVKQNILEGTLYDVEAALRLAPGQTPRLHLGYSFEKAEVRFIRTLPPVRDGYGYATIDGQTYTVVLSRGRITPPVGGGIDVSGSVLRVPDITARPARAEISLRTASSLTAALSLLDQPPFRFLSKAEKPVDLGQGQARFDLTVKMPLKRVTLGEVDYRAEGVVTGFSSDRLVAGRRVEADRLQVAADPAGLSISGPGTIDALPFDVTYAQSFAPADRGKARIEGTVELSAAAAQTFGLGLPAGFVSGQGRGQVTIALEKGKPAQLRLISDLNRIGLNLPELAWTKPAAGTGRLEAEVTLAAPPVVRRLVLEAAGLKAEGAVTMRPGGAGLDLARFDRVALDGWLKGAVELRGRGPGKPVALAMTSGEVDLRAMPPASARKSGGGGSAGAGPLELSLDRLVVSKGVTLTGFKGSFTLKGGIKGDYTARVNGGAAIAGNVSPAPKGTAVRVTSEDAGAVLRDAGIFESAIGGKLSVLMVPHSTGGDYDGQARITGVRVRNANVLAELLNAISVVGLLEQLGGTGIVFNEAIGDFYMTPNAVQIRRGSAVGASLGVSMAGVYQSGSGQLDMQGVVSPIYILNGIGALVSKRGEGIFGFNYRLRGTAEDPLVEVNPLSILTPGMFREIFRQAPPRLEGGSE